MSISEIGIDIQGETESNLENRGKEVPMDG